MIIEECEYEYDTNGIKVVGYDYLNSRAYEYEYEYEYEFIPYL